jgi:hypothetical protein
VVDEAGVAELVDRCLVGCAEGMFEARDDFDVLGQDQFLSS